MKFKVTCLILIGVLMNFGKFRSHIQSTSTLLLMNCTFKNFLLRSNLFHQWENSYLISLFWISRSQVHFIHILFMLMIKFMKKMNGFGYRRKVYASCLPSSFQVALFFYFSFHYSKMLYIWILSKLTLWFVIVLKCWIMIICMITFDNHSIHH